MDGIFSADEQREAERAAEMAAKYKPRVHRSTNFFGPVRRIVHLNEAPWLGSAYVIPTNMPDGTYARALFTFKEVRMTIGDTEFRWMVIEPEGGHAGIKHRIAEEPSR
jgi:hypothetical protein